jgi:hypothetical protein
LSKHGPRCKICSHPDRWRIELLRAGGASLESLAKKFSVSRDAIFRHWHNHVTADAKAGYLAGPAQLADLANTAATEGESVLDYLKITRTTLMASLSACGEAGDARGVAIVASQLISVLEKIGKITGEIAQIAQGAVNVNVAIVNSPEFARIQARLLTALAPFSDARTAVVAALRDLDAEAAQPAPKLIEVRPNV